MNSPNFFFSLVSFLSRFLPLSVKQAVYRSPHLARWVRGSLNKAAPEGLTSIKIAGGALAGMTMALNLNTEKAYWLGTYEVDLQRAISDLVKPGMTAYDIGANIGYVTLMLARAVGKSGKVYAFEPLPDNFKRLTDHVHINKYDDRVILSNNAVIDGSRQIDFWRGPSAAMGKADGSAGRKDLSYSERISVQGISLDEFVFGQKHAHPDVVKMDIEGGEVLALPGMKRLLKEIQPVMLLELHGFEAAGTAWEILNSAGYRICRMTPSYPTVDALEALNWKAYLVGLKM